MNRRKANCLAERVSGQEYRSQQFAGCEDILVVARHEIDDRTPAAVRRSSARAWHTPSSAAVSEIIGPAGSDMQMFPPTVASFQILNEERNDRQHWRNSGAAVQSAGALSTN